jgi:NAD(P)-dependent dehydrogenase (short-subunit alcohol dehydrogenase family)
VNNAGIFIDSFDAPSHAATVATNTDGPVDVTLALLPHLARGARVVMVASGGRLPSHRRGLGSPGWNQLVKVQA